MNAKDKAEILIANGYTHKIEGNGHAWYYPNGEKACGLKSFAKATDVTYRYMGKYPDAEQKTPVSTERFVVKFHSGGYKVWDNTHKHFVSGAFTLEADAQEIADRRNGNMQDELPQAPAPVDILREKNERIAALEAEVKELRLERLDLQRQVETLKMDDKISDEAITDLAAENALLQMVIEAAFELLDGHIGMAYNFPKIHEATMLLKKALEQQPHAAPVQADAVTLSENEIEWCIEHEIKHGTYQGFFCVPFSGAITTWDFVARVFESIYVYTSSENQYDKYYALRKDYDTPANRAAIAAKRAELDAPKSQEEYNRNRPYIA